ncbi:glycosyltransferase family 4 protein [Haloflavibacter putidus]|uniref:Glycosyltransferase family 4 protein n=1 Tax=Haloflavibacter putidus TaxID=2576776 RepID=A0A507ZCN7_9FLAO|nr:glycosyltransferase family 4 protein [Haloflavibacter putidus]TQD33824.1 glycosyltransferase family 4 protein [Haloflavibacter putidus]
MSKKIRILYTIPNFKTAGSQYVVLSLIAGINKEKFNVYIGVEKYPELIPDLVPHENKIHFAREGNSINDIHNFAQLVKQHKIEIIHSWDYKSQFVEVLGSRLAGVKYLYTKKNAAWSKRWFLKSMLSSHIAYDNPEMEQAFFSSIVLKNKISFIPHGVDTKLFRPLDSSKSSNNSKFNMCCIGNIGENKNQLFLIKALRNLPSDIYLNLYGRAETVYLKKLEKYIVELDLENRVHFKGFVKNHELPRVLNEQDLFVLASKKEGLPVSILEALACGVPVLTSDSGGGTRHIFKDRKGGEVFSIKDTLEFEEFVRKLFKSKQTYNKKAKEARDLILANYRLDKEIESYEKLYLNLKC